MIAPLERPILVTGGRGRIGALLVGALRRSGARVVSLGRSSAGHVDDVVVDMRDPAAVARVVAAERPRVVVHLASVLSGQDLVAQNELIDQAVNRAALDGQVGHLVHLSSGAVYGTRQQDRLREDSPLLGESAYAVSKIAGEELFGTLARAGVPVTTLRLFNVAGPDFPDSLVMRLLSATSESPVTVSVPDDYVRDYIHQSDVVDVLMAVVAAPPDGSHRVLNIGAGVPVTTRALLAGLRVEPAHVIESTGARSANWADITQLKAIFGLEPHAVPTPHWGRPRLAPGAPA